MAGKGVWVASTYADGLKPYCVEFDGIASCEGRKVLILKALTKALEDLEKDNRLIILYVDDVGLAGTIADIIASKPIPDSAGSGPTWKRFLFQLGRHDVLMGRFDPSEKQARELRERLDELLSWQ